MSKTVVLNKIKYSHNLKKSQNQSKGIMSRRLCWKLLPYLMTGKTFTNSE